MPTPDVRRALQDDYPAVATLADVYVAEGWADEQYATTLRDVARRNTDAEVLVAVDDGQVVGAVTVATRGGPLAELAVDGEAVIRHLVTDPAARDRGVGEALVAACINAARQDGCRLIRLSTQRDMAVAARLYTRLGFVRTPTKDWSPQPGLQLQAYALALVPWCDQCGQDLVAAEHPNCQALRALDPPRWCPQCRRRMVVQITPTTWSARCVEHGTTHALDSGDQA